MLVAIAGQSASAQDLEFGPPVVVDDTLAVPTGLGVDTRRDRLFVADTAHHRVRHTDATSLTGTINWTAFGYVSNRSKSEALNEPQAVAVDASSHAYVVDTEASEVQLYRFDGSTNSYSHDPSFANANPRTVDGTDIRFPRDIAVGPSGKIYLLDSGNNRILVADGPGDSDWSVWAENGDWGHPYGLDVGPGSDVFLADTENNRVLKLSGSGNRLETFGHVGRRAGQFRLPRDVAVGPDGRIFVADTGNHRIAILESDGSFYRHLGSAPLFDALEKIAVTADGHVYTVDSNRERVVAYLGGELEPPFDAYLRDYVGDTGTQPSDSGYTLSSPDILVRHQPDIDLEAAANSGLDHYAFQPPRHGESNYVYVAVRNRGARKMDGVTARLYWADPGSQLAFPADWNTAGFFSAWAGPSSNTPGNSLTAPTLPARTQTQGTTEDGVRLVGPLIWRPPAPNTLQSANGRVYLGVRLVNLHDPSQSASGLEQVRLNNNMAIRQPRIRRGPFPTGKQNTLVVRANFDDVSGAADANTVSTRIDETSAWLKRVTYGSVKLIPLYRGPVDLDHGKAHYRGDSRSVLIELAGEVLDKLLTSEPGLLERDAGDPDDDIDRVVIVVNDPSFDRDWATTGLWPYGAAGQTRHLSVSVQGPNNTTAQYAHGLAHQLRLKDLYIHDEVDAELSEPASGWDNMARPMDGQHPLVWSKEHAGWVTSHGAKVRYIRRPATGNKRTGEPPIHLSYQTLADPGDTAAVAIGLTEEATTLQSEHHFYWVEARSPNLSGSDPVPEGGVVVYYANNRIPQGEGPVWVRDAEPSTDHRDDAALSVGESYSPPGTGITIEVTAKRPNREGYDVDVTYDPPPEDYDVHIREGDPSWTSPDIWVDNQREGGYETYHSSRHQSDGPVDDRPIAGEDNRVYARIRNEGPAPAHDVEVRFAMSEPYHTVGGEGDFDEVATRVIPKIPAGEHRDVFFTWTPDGSSDPHNCVRVQIRRLTDDTDEANNDAQQNLDVKTSESSSPYDPVDFQFQIGHDKKTPQLYYFREDGTPGDWTKQFADSKKHVRPNDHYRGKLHLQPPPDARSCTDREIHVTAWTPRGDTLVRVGGTTVDVQLRNRTELEIHREVYTCGDTPTYTHKPTVDRTRTIDREGGPRLDTSREFEPVQCAVIETGGCTNPPRPNETIVVRYRDPAGNPVYREVTTDEHGCFRDAHVAVEGGSWEATAHYRGGRCAGPATATTAVPVPIPSTGDQDGDGLPDGDEVQGDADGDGVPNHLDEDADGDGILDGNEPNHGPDRDDGAGQPNDEDPTGDADLDGLDNVVDPDSDNDGLPDGREPDGDVDDDGRPNRVDTDSDGDGISDGADDAPYTPETGVWPSSDASWWHLLAFLLLIAAAVLFAHGHRYRRLWLIAAALFLIVGVAYLGLYIALATHILYTALLVLLAVILAVVGWRRLSGP